MDERIEISTEISAPIDRVWRALTDFREFGQWFRVELEGPFVPGQPLSGIMVYPGHEGVRWHAVIKRIKPYQFIFCWPHGDGASEADDVMTHVEFSLQSQNGGTRATVVETGFEDLPDALRHKAFEQNFEGWTIQMQNLKDYAEG